MNVPSDESLAVFILAFKGQYIKLYGKEAYRDFYAQVVERVNVIQDSSPDGELEEFLSRLESVDA